MRRATSLAYLTPAVILALAATGCVMPAYSVVQQPGADPASFTAAAEPPRQPLTVPAREDLLAKWRLPSSCPWAPYEKLTLPSVLSDAPQTLSMPDIDDLDEVRLAKVAAARVAEGGIPLDTAWIVNVTGAAAVAFGSTLTELAGSPIAAIPTFNNWPSENELVPAEDTLAAMIRMPPHLAAGGESARPVFLLDNWRLAYKEELIDEGVIDNRYMLTPQDFPSAEVLRQNGIDQVVYVVASEDILDEEDDLNELFESYEASGIAIAIVDLASLARAREPEEPAWYVEVFGNPFHVRHRTTVVHDPRFYRRARGGFGGAHLVPIRGSGHAGIGVGG